jgi:beta-galactosidase
MERENFNNGWLFCYGGGTALERTVSGAKTPVPVTLPHDAMIGEKRDPQTPTGNTTGYYPAETVHYTKEFVMDELPGAAYLEFEGVYHNAAVYINGCLAEQHSNGYTAFTVDALPFLKPGKNNVKVLVRNGVPSSRWYTGTGIYRDVWLLQAGNVHIAPNGVKITVTEADDEAAALLIETTLVNRDAKQQTLRLRHRIGDTEISAPVTLFAGETKTAALRLTLEHPKLWSIDSPYLYDCETELEGLDTEHTRFGVRTLSLDARRGLRINGEAVKLRGGCIHQDHGVIGAVEHRALTFRRIRKLKEAGYNAVRCAHFPTSRTVLEACDELGMLVMLELCDAWTIPKVDLDYSAYFLSHWKKDAAAMADLAYNHPSVILYSIGNEICEVSDPHEVQYGRQICDHIRALDPTRYLTNCVNPVLSLMERIPELAVKAGADINSILNGNAEELERLMASREIGEPLEEAFSYLDVAGYNYATFRYEADAGEYSHRVLLGAECYPGALYENWKLCEKLPQLIGDFGWAAWDYLGEAGVGQNRYGEALGYDLYGAYPWRSAGCGDFDLIGDRRPVSYWRQIVWGLRKEPYIAVQDPAHYGEKQSPTRWGWSDALRSWNYRGAEGNPIVVEVYSDADEVELLVNGHSVGKQRTVRCKALFDTVYEPGQLTAFNIRNEKPAEQDRLLTASGDVHIEETDLGNGIIELSVKDKAGVLNPEAVLTLTAETKGECTILGFGTGDPKSEGNYFDKTIRTWHGRALIVTRGEGELKIEVQ